MYPPHFTLYQPLPQIPIGWFCNQCKVSVNPNYAYCPLCCSNTATTHVPTVGTAYNIHVKDENHNSRFKNN